MDVTAALRKWIEGEMKTRGWRMTELAVESGISHATLSRIFNKKQDYLKPPTIKLLCKVFDVSRHQLYCITYKLPAPEPRIDALADWMKKQEEGTVKKILKAAEKSGFELPSSSS